MSDISKTDIEHLGTLARIKLSDEEVEVLKQEVGDILSYVGSINEVVADGEPEKQVGPVHTVTRADEVSCEPGSYTETLLAEMPDRDGNYLRVKKILNPDS